MLEIGRHPKTKGGKRRTLAACVHSDTRLKKRQRRRLRMNGKASCSASNRKDLATSLAWTWTLLNAESELVGGTTEVSTPEPPMCFFWHLAVPPRKHLAQNWAATQMPTSVAAHKCGAIALETMEKEKVGCCACNTPRRGVLVRATRNAWSNATTCYCRTQRHAGTRLYV